VSGARSLLLSHLSYPSDAARALADAGERYDGGGPIQVATPGLTLTVDGPRDATRA
jgi:ribonuclease BN (tRNA processing enzyme)